MDNFYVESCSRVTGVVLAGGLGKRLGCDKTALRLPGMDQDLLARAASLLERAGLDVRISCRADQPERAARAGNYPLLADEFPGEGALRAVYSALRQVGGPCLIIPCDMPFLTEAVIRDLLVSRALRGPDVQLTAWRQAWTGYVESLVAVYETGCLPLLEQSIVRGEYQLNKVVPENKRHHLDFNQDQAALFMNVNEAADWELARKISAEQALSAERS